MSDQGKVFVDMRLGDWRTVLEDVGEVDALITDPPYGARTHGGASVDRVADSAREIDYSHLAPDDVREIVRRLVPRVRRWTAIIGLMRAIVGDYTDPGDVVLDPFAGHGTTLLAARELGCSAVGCEIDEGAYKRAVERLAAPWQPTPHPRTKRQAATQGGLFS